MCTCGGRPLETNYHTSICRECGVETFIGYTTSNQVYSTQCFKALPQTYSRLARFRDLIRRVFALENGPRSDAPVWEYLKELAPFQSSADILTALKQSSLEHKHYSSVHLFSKVFTNYKEHSFSSTELRTLVEILCHKFETTLQRWNLLNQTSFFSYTWLIEKYLRDFNLTIFLQYVKHLQCPHRREKYEQKMISICGEHNNVSVQLPFRQNVPGGRFLSVSPVVETHRS